jgi:hypothetical protein
MNLSNYFLFENCVVKIFKEADFSIQQHVRNIGCQEDIDIVAEKDSVKYCVEIKYSLVNNKAAERIINIAKMDEMIPVLVVSEYVNIEKRACYREQFSKLILVDISNLLFVVKNNEELRNELISCLNYSVDSIEPKPIKGFMEINSLQHNAYTKSLIKEMELCKTGRTMARSYEVLCHKLLENIFAEDLTLWREQQKSNKDLYKFDLLCRIKENNQKTFWSIIERYFNSKYIIFEFKNYSESITQKEIYTTEKYLYAKALRCVAIIISQNGYDENAYWAAKGCLRENGKLLILLNTDDLIEMNKMKENLEDPSNYLLSKLDDILMELEK